MTAMARLPCKQTSSSQQPRVNNFGNSYWNMQTRHPAPPYVRNHQRHTDHTADGILSPQQTLPPALPPKSPRLVPVPQRRTISGPPSSTGGDQLQTKLRRLLNTDSKENVFFPDSPTQTVVQSNGVPQEEKFRYSPGSLSPSFRDDERAKNESLHKNRFSLEFDCWSHIRRDSGASTQHSTEKDRSRRGSYANGTPPSVVRRYSPESESSNSQTDYSPTCNSRFSDGWKEGRGRPILRSKSDISDRYWRQDNGRSNKVPARPPRSITQLENFFDCLGLDSDNYQRITKPDSKSSSPVFFDSVSSVDSALGLYSWAANNQTNQGSQWQNNDCSVGMGNDDSNQRVSDPPSIVERNARIIKWLCQCRKVQFGFS
ncbi:Protein FAM110B [Habropoda laboriosa]|uniref:Protein FAM110B n=1 Tax=Habropoda laboriosa TaxID=597456 RepID=A0A0L7QUT2_9HYME|nr:Protein FAM110B [Habropoda laboriosa]